MKDLSAIIAKEIFVHHIFESAIRACNAHNVVGVQSLPLSLASSRESELLFIVALVSSLSIAALPLSPPLARQTDRHLVAGSGGGV